METVALDEEKKALVILDQTRLPSERKMLSLKTGEEIWEAIYLLKVRGAPAIGEQGLSLLRPGFGLLTHCNAGRLATVAYGYGHGSHVPWA